MKKYALVLCLILAACNTAGPHFRGLEATQVTVDGSTFDVRVRGDLAEALRVNVEYAPRFGPIAGRAKQAMEQVSGCVVTEVRGDQALATGLLKCGKGAPVRLRPGQTYQCAPVKTGQSPVAVGRASAYTCVVVG